MQTLFKSVRGTLTAFILFLLIWGGFSCCFDAYVIPSPLKIIASSNRLLDRAFFDHAAISLMRITMGFGIAFGLGSGMGIFSAAMKVSSAVETFLLLFQVIPGVILGLVFLLIFGVGSTAPIALIVILTTPIIAVNTANSLMKRNRVLEGVIRSFNGGFRHLLCDLYLPALIPAMKTNLTMGAVLSVKILLLGEFLASNSGIGYLLNISKIYFNMEAVFFYLLVILLGIVFFQIIVNTLFSLFFSKYLYPE